jgi:hypothetical protein
MPQKGAALSTPLRTGPGLRAAVHGVRNDHTREVIASYVRRIVIWPSKKEGEMVLNPDADWLWKGNNRPEERSWFNLVGASAARLNCCCWHSLTPFSKRTRIQPQQGTLRLRRRNSPLPQAPKGRLDLNLHDDLGEAVPVAVGEGLRVTHR